MPTTVDHQIDTADEEFRQPTERIPVIDQEINGRDAKESIEIEISLPATPAGNNKQNGRVGQRTNRYSIR
jgi:hypothetical protein